MNDSTSTSKNSVGISFGALSDSLEEQLIRQGWKYNEKQIKLFQSQTEAIHTLRFADLLTNSMTDKIFEKLHKKIVAHVAKENGRKVIKP